MIQKKAMEQHLTQLDAYENVFIDLSKQLITADNGHMFPLDCLTVAVINRSLSLLAGFSTLLKNENYIAAVHLVRPHLDNYLRFSAAWLVSEPHEFAMSVMKGERIDKIKDRDGKFLRDSYLVEMASKDYPWIQNVYKETSGFIHLSSKHVFTSSTIKDAEKGIIEFKISKDDKYVHDNFRIEAIEGMFEITDCLIHLIESWIWTKNNPNGYQK